MTIVTLIALDATFSALSVRFRRKANGRPLWTGEATTIAYSPVEVWRARSRWCIMGARCDAVHRTVASRRANRKRGDRSYAETPNDA